MTIKEIAALANVSPGTVSKVLNNKDASISAETRRKVLQIAKAQHYRPYSEALESFGRRSYLIGLLFPQEESSAEELQKCLAGLFAKSGYLVITGFYEDKTSFETCMRGMRSRHVDAVLVFSNSREVDAAADEETELSVFKIGGISEGQSQALLLDDKVQLAYMAAQYLIAQGHNNIGILGVHPVLMTHLSEGLAKAYFQQGIVWDTQNVFCDAKAGIVAGKGAHDLINRNVTAIICENMDIVCGVYQTCSRHGLRIPQDISVICLCDDVLGTMLRPAVTALKRNTSSLAKACVDRILKHLEEKIEIEANRSEDIYQIIHRESVSEPVRDSLAMQSKVLVLGSMNMDETIRVKALPGDGETILSDMKMQLPGGKGANQAIGVARLGGTVYAMGRIGNDIDGRKIYAALKSGGVMTEGVLFDASVPTGKAYIHAADNGEGTIVVYPGANLKFTVDQIEQYRYLFERVGYCLLPIEIVAEPMMHALKVCREYGVKTVVKPSLQTNIPEDMLSYIDYLVPNEKELERIVCEGNDREAKMDWLLGRGVGHVIVTLGSKGCHLKDSVYNVLMDAPDFEPVDVTGAADAFIAALTVYMNMGHDIIAAMCYASYAAGVSITRMGVQPALADRMMMDVYQDEIQKNVLRIREAMQ